VETGESLNHGTGGYGIQRSSKIPAGTEFPALFTMDSVATKQGAAAAWRRTRAYVGRSPQFPADAMTTGNWLANVLSHCLLRDLSELSNVVTRPISLSLSLTLPAGI
jgi:hypothetical protein